MIDERTKDLLYRVLVYVIIVGGVWAVLFLLRDRMTPVRIEGNIRVTTSPTPVPSPTEVWCGMPIETREHSK